VPGRAVELLSEIGLADRARSVVTAKGQSGQRIIGFGQAV
jgi:citrate synthase